MTHSSQLPANLQTLLLLVSRGNATFETYQQLAAAAGGSIAVKEVAGQKHYAIVLDGQPHRVDRFIDLKKWFMANIAPYLELIAAEGRLPEAPKPKPHISQSGDIQCISCGSTQLHSGQRGYSFMRGGIFGSSQVLITCLKCSQKFYPGGKPY